MTWQTAVAISILANVATTLVQRSYSQKSSVPATFPPAASYLFGVVPVGLIAGFFVFPHAITWSWWLVLLLVLQGTSMALAGLWGFQVAKRLNIAQQLTIGRFTQILVIALGWGILGEGLTMPQFIGGTILLISALLAIWAPVKTNGQAQRKLSVSSIALALAASAALAVGLVTEKAILGHMEVGGVFLVGWTVQCLGMLLLAAKDVSRHNLQKLKGYELRSSVLMGVANGLTGVFYVYAMFHSDNISIISAVMSVGLPLSVLGAYIFLHERENHALMWLSLAVSFAGLLVMAL